MMFPIGTESLRGRPVARGQSGTLQRRIWQNVAIGFTWTRKENEHQHQEKIDEQKEQLNWVEDQQEDLGYEQEGEELQDDEEHQ